MDGIALATGTGGTIAGCSIYLKEKNPKIKCYMMDIPGSGIVPEEQRDADGHLVLRPMTPEEKAKSGNSFMEGIGTLILLMNTIILHPCCPYDMVTQRPPTGSGQLYGNLAKAKLDGFMRSQSDAPAVRMTYYLLKHEGLFLGKRMTPQFFAPNSVYNIHIHYYYKVDPEH